MQTKIVMIILTIVTFFLGQVYQARIIEQHIRRIYQIFKDKEETYGTKNMTDGVKAVYELLFKKEPPI